MRYWQICLTTLLITPQLFAVDQTVTIYRDQWGVPHIYAKQMASGAYGLGYAQAEDRLADIYIGIRTGMGRLSEVFGKEFIEHDYLMRLCRNESIARAAWKSQPDHVKEMLTHFTLGIQRYAADHPEQVPAFAMPLEPWMIQTVGRAMVLRWPLGTIQDDLKNAGDRPRPPTLSNQWAVTPSRTADRVAILLSDPHLTWEGLAVLYEARVHAGDLHMNGFFLIGSPILGIGHNRHVGWALTTGGPDTADVYRMKVRHQERLEYEYDGEWLPFEVDRFSIPVNDGPAVDRIALHSHLGPVIVPPDLKTGVAYVGSAPLLEKTGLTIQFYRMCMAKNVDEFYEAIAMGEFNEQNIMFADIHGDIGYVRAGATPVRPPGYDWSAPVAGHTSETAWRGSHPIQDLVQIMNPPQGYMQNCNISPANMMQNSSLQPSGYSDYIYNVTWDTENPRSRRIRALLDANDAITREQAIAYAMDAYDVLGPLWQQQLKQAVQNVGQDYMQNRKFADAVDAILAWDGVFSRDAQATAVYKFWRLKCGKAVDLSPLAAGRDLPRQDQQQCLKLLQQTIDEMEKRYGRWNVPWGKIHQVGRGGQNFPVGGADFQSGNKEANFSETLFDVRSVERQDRPTYYLANSGSMAMVLMFFHKDRVESLTCIPWGQNAHEDSPHFMDQGEHLYSKRQMKPTWWEYDELMQHVESKRVLRIH
ncbi:MAG: hypothetical protein CMJ80_02105 [Planctomycetaceae bacterium]|nr:hypothetical protein [Planctomycetaceae bacterium]